MTAYRPCKTVANLGSVYNQHLRYWRNKGEFECPLALFDQQFEEQIQEWLHAGEQLVIGIDANEDIQTGQTAAMMNRLGLQDAVLSSFPGQAPPETNLKNDQQTPIDALYVTPGILPTTAGYMPYFQMAFSDHRALFITVPYESCLGHNLPNVPLRLPRRIKAKDPRSRELYNRITKQEYAKAKNFIPAGIKELQAMQSSNASKIEIVLLHSKLL